MDKYILIQFYKPEKSIGWKIYYQQFPTKQEAIDNLYTENNTTHQSCYAKIINGLNSIMVRFIQNGVFVEDGDYGSLNSIMVRFIPWLGNLEETYKIDNQNNEQYQKKVNEIFHMFGKSSKK